MRRMFMGLILGAALGLPARAALACGDHVDCSGSLLPLSRQSRPIQVVSPCPAPAIQAGAPATTPFSLMEMRGLNREH